MTTKLEILQEVEMHITCLPLKHITQRSKG